MKHLIIGFILLVFSTQFYGQMIGVAVSPNLTITDKDGKIGRGLSAGVYFDQKIYKRWGISTGLYYTEFLAANRGFACLACGSCPCPDRIDNKFSVLEIPLDVRINANRTINTSPWNIGFNIGYSYSRLLSMNAIVYDEGKVEIDEISTLVGLHKAFHIGRIGFEISKDISNKFILGFGGMYKYTGIYDQVYGGFNNWNLTIKTGYNLAKVKR